MALIFSYIRFSGKHQERGDSTKRQREGAEAWLARHPEHTLDTTLRLRDLGVSAFKGANLDREIGDLGKFIWLAQHDKKRVPPGSILLLERLDRFSRDNALVAVNILSGLILAGVTVVTLFPERVADRKTGGKMEVLLPMVMDLIIANEYSAALSYRVGKAWLSKRERATKGQQKMTRACPSWLTLSDDRTHFIEIPEKVATVKRIFRLALEGVGSFSIARQFTAESVPLLSTRRTSTRWNKSYVDKLLSSPSVYGELQPCVGGRKRRDRKPVGDAIPNYYPVIISRKDFDRAQAARTRRKIATGPSSKRIGNLFTGILHDARDRATMVRVDKGNGLVYLISSSAHISLRTAKRRHLKKTDGYIGFSYGTFERAVLRFLNELKPHDILPASSARNALRDDLEALDGRLTQLAARIRQASKALDDGGEIPSGFALLRKWEADKQAAEIERDRLSRALTASETAALTDTQQTIKVMESATGDDLYGIRQRAKQQIRNLVSAIWLRIFDADLDDVNCRIALAEIRFATGVKRYIVIPDNRRDKNHEPVAVTVTPKLAGKIDIERDDPDRLTALAVGLLRLRKLVASEKKPLVEVLRAAVNPGATGRR